jgi:hypothetical protein
MESDAGRARAPSTEQRVDSPVTFCSAETFPSLYQQQHGDRTAEQKIVDGAASVDSEDVHETVGLQNQKVELGKNPGEIAFFKLLHSELKKATHFFDKAQREFTIREDRVREGMEIMKRPNSIMVNEKVSADCENAPPCDVI